MKPTSMMGGGGTGPTPQQLLTLESSTFRLSQKCFEICATPALIRESVKNPSQRASQDEQFNECVRNCTVTFIQTRQYMKDKFLTQMDSTVEKNMNIYKDFGV